MHTINIVEQLDIRDFVDDILCVYKVCKYYIIDT